VDEVIADALPVEAVGASEADNVDGSVLDHLLANDAYVVDAVSLRDRFGGIGRGVARVGGVAQAVAVGVLAWTASSWGKSSG
jgi:hypothetical protein